MQTGDGLLARIRIAGNHMTPAQLAALARLARQHGNGILEVTARGNLQIRGLTPASAPLLAATATALVPIETGLVIDISPLAGEDAEEKADSVALAARIRAGALSIEGQLGPKVSVVVDGGGQISLAALKADIRLRAVDASRWAVVLGGGKPQIMDADGAIVTTLAVLSALAALGPDARATDLFPASDSASVISEPARDMAERLELMTGYTSPVALPFGQIDGEALIALAECPGLTTIRLAPGHTLLLDNVSTDVLDRAAALGFITKFNDPRRHVSACIGSEGCASGHIPARRLANALAPHVAADRHLHVSGCTKGCAHPRAADLTLVGRNDGIGLVIAGRAGDTPSEILDEAGLIPALVARREGR